MTESVEIKIVRKNEDGEVTEILQLVAKEKDIGEITAWEDLMWKVLSFVGFYPKTIDRFLSGEDYDKRVGK
jgi:hypothetical protein